ncbi:hypothetical protein LCGC14_2615170 [marine sediment metagenome]|uniref:Uncharacterized protein n=1 Tax=marine sediment metagenome TaxID=412755 RepID=A0A0F9CXD5_9ZZZZ
MLGEIGREGRAGIIVSFLLEGTLELLWKSSMQHPPRVDELVGLLGDGEVETWYKVEEVRYEFRYETSLAGGGEIPEVPMVSEYARNAPIVVVSVVL